MLVSDVNMNIDLYGFSSAVESLRDIKMGDTSIMFGDLDSFVAFIEFVKNCLRSSASHYLILKEMCNLKISKLSQFV